MKHAVMCLVLAACEQGFLHDGARLAFRGPDECRVIPPPTATSASVSAAAVTLTWASDDPEIQGFYVERAFGGDWLRTGPFAADARDFNDTEIATDEIYRYRVVAYVQDCASAASNEMDAVTWPNAPGGFAATTVGAASLLLTWQDTNENEAGYVLTCQAGDWLAEEDLPPNATTWLMEDLQTATEYECELAAQNTSGIASDAISLTVATPVAAPNILTAVAAGTDSIDLLWEDTNSGRAKHRVERRVSVTENWATVATVAAGSTSYTDSGLGEEQGYIYRVVAVVGSEEASSSSLSERTRFAPKLALGAPVMGNACALTVPGIAVFDADKGAAFASATALSNNLDVTGATVDGFSGAFSQLDAASVGVDWIVTDTHGVMSQLRLIATVNRSYVGQTTVTTPSLELGQDAGAGRQVWFDAFEDDATSGACTSCTGLRASLLATARESCALKADGTVACWGWRSALPISVEIDDGIWVPTYLEDIVMMGSGASLQGCAVLQDSSVWCWDGAPLAKEVCVTGEGLGCGGGSRLTGVVSVSSGWQHSCAVTLAGEVRCWGTNDVGQLGDGTTNNATNPVTVCKTGSGDSCAPLVGAVAVSAGWASTCALLEGGSIACWGANTTGALGDGTTISRVNPVYVCQSGSTEGACVALGGAVAVQVSDEYACAVVSLGQVTCWGRNNGGMLIDKTNYNDIRANPRTLCVNDANTSTCVPIQSVTALATAASHICALFATGEVQCWGQNAVGELGRGFASTREVVPEPVCLPEGCASGTLSSIVAITSRCALTVTGELYCWGDNSYGQLGVDASDGPEWSGAIPYSALPVRVCQDGTGPDCTVGDDAQTFDDAAVRACVSYTLEGVP